VADPRRVTRARTTAVVDAGPRLDAALEELPTQGRVRVALVRAANT
jgi:hypothetical protein